MSAAQMLRLLNVIYVKVALILSCDITPAYFNHTGSAVIIHQAQTLSYCDSHLHIDD